VDADDLDLVSVNDLADAENLAYLVNYDTVYGRYRSVVGSEPGVLLIESQKIPVYSPKPIQRSCRGASSRSTSSWSAPARSGTSKT
jgi:glyceraldehyde-3-phosphate dehydrogenase/erythrose-4-phosphate dehydrogenase